MDQKFNRLFLIYSLIVCFSSLSDASSIRVLERYCTLTYNDTMYYDLRSLSLRSEHLTVANGNDTYFVNICSTTNAFKSAVNKTALCPSTSSICLVNSNRPIEGFEIASLHATRLLVENGSLYMRFENSDEEEAKKIHPSCKEISTSILFSCENSRPNEEKPVLKNRNNCTFDFEWKTSEACVDKHTVIEPHAKNDSLIFKVNATIVDLNEILKPQAIKTQYENAGKTESYDFVIKINELKSYTDQKNFNLTECANAFVCQVNMTNSFNRAIAKLEGSQLKHANGRFHLYMSSNSKCGRDPRKLVATIFNFYCNTTQTPGSIEFVAENNLCHYVFNVTNPKVCEYEAIFDGLAKKSGETAKPSTDKPEEKPKTGNSAKPPASSSTAAPPAVKPDPAKKSDSSSTSSAKLQGNPDENNSNTTAFGLVILALVTIVGVILVFFALINDDRRSWLQKRLRRLIQNPQTSNSFHYSQLPANNILLMNNNQTENFSSPYSPTVMPKADQFRYDTLVNERNSAPKNSLSGDLLASGLPNSARHPANYDLRSNSNHVRSSIREQLDRLKLINDNDLGVSSGDFHRSIGFRGERPKDRPHSKDEELDLLT